MASRLLASAFGLFCVATAYYRARRGMEPSEPLFWLGLLVIVFPIAVSLWSPAPSRAQRVWLLLLLGLALYAVKVLRSPDGFAFYDEFSHWRTASDIASSADLFSANPLQPISAFYPGLEAITTTFATWSSLSLGHSAIVVIGLGRVLLVVGLFMLFERASGSSRVAGAGVLLYAANPSFVFFDAQFSYESFAVGLAVAVLALLAARSPSDPATARRISIVAALVVLAVVVTHHVTTFMLAAFLLIWSAVGRLRATPPRLEIPPVRHAALAIGASIAWLAAMAPLTVGYLAPNTLSGLQQLILLVAGESPGRRLFEDPSGGGASPWERVVTYLSVALILAGLPPALWMIRRSLAHRPMVIALSLVALLYPLSLGLRVTAQGAESGARLSGFAFVGVAFVLAIWVTRPWAIRALRSPLLAAVSVVIFTGGTILGLPPWARLPYPFRPAADVRAVDPEAIAAARWADVELGPHHRFLSDRMDRQLLGSFGRQDPTYTVRQADLFLSSSITPGDLRVIRVDRIAFVLTDRRLTTATPLVSSYVVVGEHRPPPLDEPLDPVALAKFDGIAQVSRVFDSGNIQIFDLRGLW